MKTDITLHQLILTRFEFQNDWNDERDV